MINQSQPKPDADMISPNEVSLKGLKTHWISQLLNQDYIKYRQKDITFPSDVKQHIADILNEILEGIEKSKKHSTGYNNRHIHFNAGLDKANQIIKEIATKKQSLNEGKR